MASMGSGSSRRTSMAWSAIEDLTDASATNASIPTSVQWLRTMAPVRENQKRESPVSTAPLPGIGSGRTTSNADSRSVATMSRCSSPAA